MGHPSCSKQYAVLQYRQVEKEQSASDGFKAKEICPYIMDLLKSTNGTFINNKRIEPQRYYEIREKDTISLEIAAANMFCCTRIQQGNNYHWLHRVEDFLLALEKYLDMDVGSDYVEII